METGGLLSIESYIEAGDFTGLADHCEEAEIMVSVWCGTISHIHTTWNGTGSSRSIIGRDIREFTSSVPSAE